MEEIFKHMFGLCGDNHPSVLYLLGLSPLIFLRNIIITKLSEIILFVKNCLRFFQ